MAKDEALGKFKKVRKLLKYLTYKSEVDPDRFTAGDQRKLMKVQKKYAKLKKMMAFKLMEANRKRKAAKGRGKKRGSDLMKLMG